VLILVEPKFGENCVIDCVINNSRHALQKLTSFTEN